MCGALLITTSISIIYFLVDVRCQVVSCCLATDTGGDCIVVMSDSDPILPSTTCFGVLEPNMTPLDPMFQAGPWCALSESFLQATTSKVEGGLFRAVVVVAAVVEDNTIRCLLAVPLRLLLCVVGAAVFEGAAIM